MTAYIPNTTIYFIAGPRRQSHSELAKATATPVPATCPLRLFQKQNLSPLPASLS